LLRHYEATRDGLMSHTNLQREQIALALMYSALHDERWVWKNIPFEITDWLRKAGSDR